MWYSCLLCGNHVNWRHDPLAQYFMIGAQGTSPFVQVSKCRSECSSKGLERKRSSLLIVCVHELLESVEPWLSLSLSLFPSSFLSFFSFYNFFLFFISLLIFSLFFFSLFSFFFKQAKANTFLKQGYSFGWLKLAARCLAISPTLGLLSEDEVCNVGVSFRVCSNSKEPQSVQLMQTSCSRTSYVPCSS